MYLLSNVTGFSWSFYALASIRWVLSAFGECDEDAWAPPAHVLEYTSALAASWRPQKKNMFDQLTGLTDALSTSTVTTESNPASAGPGCEHQTIGSSCAARCTAMVRFTTYRGASGGVTPRITNSCLPLPTREPTAIPDGWRDSPASRISVGLPDIATSRRDKALRIVFSG